MVAAADPAPAKPQGFTAAFPAAPAEMQIAVEPQAAPVAAPAAAIAAPRVASAVVTPVWHNPPRAAALPVRVAAADPAHLNKFRGTHLVQLGSFSSAQGARRAWGILSAHNGELRHLQMVITPAKVRGHDFWRVAAAGFTGPAANGLCSAVKARGGACFAYASARTLTSPVAKARPMMAVAAKVKLAPVKAAAPKLAKAAPAAKPGVAGPSLARRR